MDVPDGWIAMRIKDWIYHDRKFVQAPAKYTVIDQNNMDMAVGSFQLSNRTLEDEERVFFTMGDEELQFKQRLGPRLSTPTPPPATYAENLGGCVVRATLHNADDEVIEDQSFNLLHPQELKQLEELLCSVFKVEDLDGVFCHCGLMDIMDMGIDIELVPEQATILPIQEDREKSFAFLNQQDE